MSMRAISIALGALLCAATLPAQTLDRAQRPVAPPPRPFTLPPVTVDTLPNGLRLFVVEDHSVPVVSVNVVIGADSSRDPVGKQGLSRLMIDGLREGTTTRTADQLGAAGAAIGTSVTPTSFTTITRSFAPALDLLGDMLMHPAFDSAGLERRKAQQAARVRALAQAPATPARRIFYSNVVGPQDAMVRTLAASPTALAAVTRADILRAYAESVDPRSTAIVVAGDVTNQAARREVARVFGGWRGSARAAAASAEAPAPRPTTIYLVDAPGTNAVVYFGVLGPKRSEPDVSAAEVMASIVATRFQSELRDRRSLIYSGASGFVWRPDPMQGVFVGSTGVDVKRVDSAVAVTLALLRDMRGAQPASAAEISASIQRLVGPLPSRIDGAEQLAATVADLLRDNLSPKYREGWARSITGVTAKDVAAAAQKYLDTEHLVIVVAGDRKVTEPALRAANIAPVVAVSP